MPYPAPIAHGMMFHHFHDEKHVRGQGSISQDDFEALLQFVGVERILSPAEWLERLADEALEDEHLCLTFDDALRCQFDIARPVLDTYDLKAFWFVYSSVCEEQIGKLELYRFFRSTCFTDIDAFYALFFQRVMGSGVADQVASVVKPEAIAQLRAWFPFYSDNDAKFRLIRDRVLSRQAYEGIMDGLVSEFGLNVEEIAKRLWMSNEQLRELSDQGHLVGLHSYSHPTVLASLSPEEQAEEYRRNAEHLRAVCGQDPIAMAHPSNSYSDQTIEILRGLGIRCGFRSNMAFPQPGRGLNPNPFELAREDHTNIMNRLRR